MLRLNFSTVLVAMVMGAPYEQYYFVPLICFWFIFLYLFMVSWPRVTRSNMLGEWAWPGPFRESYTVNPIFGEITGLNPFWRNYRVKPLLGEIFRVKPIL